MLSGFFELVDLCDPESAPSGMIDVEISEEMYIITKETAEVYRQQIAKPERPELPLNMAVGTTQTVRLRGHFHSHE